jgi:hypothetical protein
MSEDIVDRLKWHHANSQLLAGRPLFKEAAEEIAMLRALRKTCGESWMAAYRLGIKHAKEGSDDTPV